MKIFQALFLGAFAAKGGKKKAGKFEEIVFKIFQLNIFQSEKQLKPLQPLLKLLQPLKPSGFRRLPSSVLVIQSR